MNATSLAEAIGIPAESLDKIIDGRYGVTTDIALRLARYFGTTPELWLNLQAFYDLRIAQLQSGDSRATAV